MHLYIRNDILQNPKIEIINERYGAEYVYMFLRLCFEIYKNGEKIPYSKAGVSKGFVWFSNMIHCNVFHLMDIVDTLIAYELIDIKDGCLSINEMDEIRAV